MDLQKKPNDAETMKRRKTFISYSRCDRAIVIEMIKMLKTQGNKVNEIVWDEDIEPGAKWREWIDNEIDRSNLMIVFWCCHSGNSDYVEYEMQRGMQKKVPIIPVKCCSYIVPNSLEEFQWIDMAKILFHKCQRILHSSGSDSNAYPGSEFMIPAPPETVKRRISNNFILLNLVLIVLLIIRPIPPLLGTAMSWITNIFIGLIAIITTIILYGPDAVVEFKRRRAIKKVFGSEISNIHANPYKFYPKIDQGT